MALGEYILKELQAMVQFHKYRTIKKNYYSEELEPKRPVEPEDKT